MLFPLTNSPTGTREKKHLSLLNFNPVQISNTLVNVCTGNLHSYATKQGKDQDRFWTLLTEAVQSEMKKSPPSSAASLPPKKHKLISTLNSCIELSGKFREIVEHLRDTFLPLGGPHTNSTTTGATSINRGSNASLGSNRYSFFAKGGQRSSTRAHFSGANSASKPSNTLVGVALSNVDKITHELKDFSARASKVLDIVMTLAQFRQLNMNRKLEGLPRVAGLWELTLPENCEAESEGASQAMSTAATSKRAPPDVRDAGLEQQSRSKIRSDDSDVTLATPDFLEQLMKEKVVQDGAVVPQPLSTLIEEESLIESVKSVTSAFKDKGIPILRINNIREFHKA